MKEGAKAIYTQSTCKEKPPLILNYLIFGAFIGSLPQTQFCVHLVHM